MNKILKMIHVGKKKRMIESDAAPARPRTEQEMLEETSSSEEESADISQNSCRPRALADQQPDDEAKNFNTTDYGSFDSSFSHQTINNNHISMNHCHGIQIGHQYTFHSSPPHQMHTARDEHVKPQPPPPHVEKTFSNRKPAKETDFLSIISDVSNVRGLAKELGLKETVVDQLYADFKEEQSPKVVHRLLQKWKELQPKSTTTVGMLCEALWKANEQFAAQTLFKLHSRDSV